MGKALLQLVWHLSGRGERSCGAGHTGMAVAKSQTANGILGMIAMASPILQAVCKFFLRVFVSCKLSSYQQCHGGYWPLQRLHFAFVVPRQRCMQEIRVKLHCRHTYSFCLQQPVIEVSADPIFGVIP